MRQKTFAIAAVLTLLCAAFVGIAATDRQEEPDGFPPLVIALVIAGTFATGTATGWVLNDYFDADNEDSRSYMRLAAANNVTDVMSVASTFTANSNANYSQLWAMTKEHWIRQAELEAYTEWSSGKEYEGNSILLGARAYENNSTMTANAVAQIDSFFGELSQKISDWGSKDTYSGKMDVGFVFDNTYVLSSSCDWNADLISVADVSGKTGKIYIGNVSEDYIVTSDDYSPAYVYNFGARTVITAEDGTAYAVENGKTYLSSLKSTVGGKDFEEGLYTVSDAIIGGDTLSSVMGTAFVPLKAGLSLHTDGHNRFAVLDGDKVSYQGNSYGSISFKVVPSDTPTGEDLPDSVDLTQILKAYQRLLDKMYWTSVSANSSAAAVWDIYNRADEKDFGVTTLMASNVYDSVVLSEGMNEILTLSAMQQLATYYDSNGEDLTDLKIGLYGDGMDAPFVRGNILDEYGNRIFDDVIFTPFFQSDDVRLERGIDHNVSQNTLVAIWSEGRDLSEWYNDAMKTNGYEVAYIEDGYTFEITQLGICDESGMHNEASVDFKISKVNYIEPGKTNLTEDSDPKEGANAILKVICIVAGAILAVYGLVSRRFELIIGGAALIVFGFLFADTVSGWISKAVRL